MFVSPLQRKKTNFITTEEKVITNKKKIYDTAKPFFLDKTKSGEHIISVKNQTHTYFLPLAPPPPFSEGGGGHISKKLGKIERVQVGLSI